MYFKELTLPNKQLFINIPLSKALFRFFNHLEDDVLKATTRPGSYKAYIFGGCALHIHTNTRGSSDIDVEFIPAKWMGKKDVVITRPSVSYNMNGEPNILTLDRNFTPMLGPLHEDYQDDAIQLQKRFHDSPLWLYIVTAEDLAVSKLGRYGERDIQDILILLKMQKMTVDSFRKRAESAIDYYVGDHRAVTGHLNHVLRLYSDKTP